MRSIKLITFVSAILLWVGCGGPEKNDAGTTQEQANGGANKDTVAEHQHDGGEGEQHNEEDAETAYACPMHPEVTGNKGDSCPKCGMDLEERK